MISIPYLISTLETRGVFIWAEGDLMKWHDPQGVLTPEIRKVLVYYKDEVLAFAGDRKPLDFLEKHMNSVILGDCMDILRFLPAECVDQMVCDPPYGLFLNGMGWDRTPPSAEILSQWLWVLKPGGFAFVCASPRQDLLIMMIIALQSAGFEVGFTSLYWTYAKGFPKAYDISKAVDRKFGAEREVIDTKTSKINFSQRNKGDAGLFENTWTPNQYAVLDVTVPASRDAKSLEGAYGGYQPKPAVEPIIVAMKPLAEKNYTDQALANGHGITRLHDVRIPYKNEKVPTRNLVKQRSYACGQVPASQGESWEGKEKGRFPANLLVSDDVLGPYSRFFSLDAWAEKHLPFLIVPKASKSEREKGLEHLEGKYARNFHPCVKPVELMANLIKMASKPGDLILDAMAGSGSSLVAAKLIGRNFIGIEKDKEYHRIAAERVKHASPDDPYFQKIVEGIDGEGVVDDADEKKAA